MSATLLLLWTIIAGTRLIAACNNLYVSDFIGPLHTEILPLDSNGVASHPRNRTIKVEEVDKDGNSVIKVLELPDYDLGQEMRGDRNRSSTEPETGIGEKANQDEYGCDERNENQRRKCLRQRKKLLKERYKTWKWLIRGIIKDLDRKIKNLRTNCIRKSRNENLNNSSEWLVGTMRRKKP